MQTDRIGSARVGSLPTLLGLRLHTAYRCPHLLSWPHVTSLFCILGWPASCPPGVPCSFPHHGLVWSLLCPRPRAPRCRCPWVTFLFITDQRALPTRYLLRLFRFLLSLYCYITIKSLDTEVTTNYHFSFPAGAGKDRLLFLFLFCFISNALSE